MLCNVDLHDPALQPMSRLLAAAIAHFPTFAAATEALAAHRPEMRLTLPAQAMALGKALSAFGALGITVDMAMAVNLLTQEVGWGGERENMH